MTLKRLVTDLVDLGALGSGAYRIHIEPVRLRTLLEGCVEPFAPRAVAKGLSFDWGLRPGVPPLVHTDAARLCQVLEVLLDNAVRLTSQGGVSLSVSLADPPAGAQARGVAAGAWIELVVSDTGPGMSHEDQQRVLTLFQLQDRPDRSLGGGLSLPVAARWCSALGGCLRVDSDGVSGSSFIVCLPVGQPAATESVGNPDLSPPMPA